MKKKELAVTLAFVSLVSAACIRLMRAASDALAREKEKNSGEKKR